MTFKITKTNKPTLDEIRQQRELVDLAANRDDYTIKVYWDVLHKRGGTYLSDYYYYIDQQLVGVMNMYRFKSDLVEIVALVHPDFRRQGVYRMLFNEALQELKRIHIERLSFVCHDKAKEFISYLNRRQVKFDHSEDQILATERFTLPKEPVVQLRLAHREDLDMLAIIHHESFGGEIEAHRRYLMNCFDESHYEIWICYYHDQAVGKIHLYFNEFNEVLIHDLGIRTEFRRQNLGSAMLLNLVQQLQTEQSRSAPKSESHPGQSLRILADIYTSDSGVVEFYRKCEFLTVNRYHFLHSNIVRWT
jgi:N-acetylglutamate synthase-like GNAT family acetyltransferase